MTTLHPLKQATRDAASMNLMDWCASFYELYALTPNLTYRVVDNIELKLDIYAPRDYPEPNPTILYIHGGGWVMGTKEEAALWALLPYLGMGWSMVNVEYRLGPTHPAPAAVEDCRWALAWLYENAEAWHFDPERILITGHSAGGHLSLTTGMMPLISGAEKPRPAAILNWYGISDVEDLLGGPNEKDYAVSWMAGQANAVDIARSVSPIHLIQPGIPPILTVHGDADDIVPYSHAVRLHEALDREGLRNHLATVPRGGHAFFPAEEQRRAYAQIWNFLAEHGFPIR